MLTVEGIYKNGTIVLSETPEKVVESKVLVTFLESKEINLSERGIDITQAAELRTKFNAVAEDWDQPEMNIYDD